MNPYKKQRIQIWWKAAMITCFVSAFLLMGYAMIGKATRKKNIAVAAAMGLVVGGGWSKWRFDKNEVKFYNN